MWFQCQYPHSFEWKSWCKLKCSFILFIVLCLHKSKKVLVCKSNKLLQDYLIFQHNQLPLKWLEGESVLHLYHSWKKCELLVSGIFNTSSTMWSFYFFHSGQLHRCEQVKVKGQILSCYQILILCSYLLPHYYGIPRFITSDQVWIFPKAAGQGKYSHQGCKKSDLP